MIRSIAIGKKMASSLKKIHVNQHAIRKNRKSGETQPVITCKTYKENLKGNTVEILGPDGSVVAAVVYRPDSPMSCGATCWVETRNEVKIT